LSVELIAAGVDGAFVIASAIIFSALALKSRSVKSFSFQFSIFMLLWAAAEVPAVLSSVGVIVATAYETVGLELHFLSMFVFAGFVFLRGRTTFGQMRLNQLAEKAAYSGISKAIDVNGAKALGFYVDYGLVAKDPGRFDTMLKKVFRLGSEAIESNILDELYLASGLQRDGSADLDFVSAVSRVTAATKKL
jgi:hypothetical protein